MKFKKSYLYYYALAGTDPIVWNLEHSGDSSFAIKGWIPLQTYLFKIKAVGKKQESVETEVITKVVL